MEKRLSVLALKNTLDSFLCSSGAEQEQARCTAKGHSHPNVLFTNTNTMEAKLMESDLKDIYVLVSKCANMD